MRWLFVELMPLLIGAALIGLGIGYLLWRWRRRRVSAEMWSELNGRLDHAERQLADDEAEIDRLTDQLMQVRSVLADGDIAAKLERVDALEVDLDAQRRLAADRVAEVERLQARNRQLEASLHEARVTLAKRPAGDAESAELRRRVRELETELRTLRAQRSRPEAAAPAPRSTPDRWSQQSSEPS